jgi:transposase
VAVSDKSTIAEVIRYGFNHWQGRSKTAFFAGHDQGAVNWACIASLIETAKLHGIDPKPYLADVLNGWPMAKIDELSPWAWAQQNKVSLAA